MFAVILVVGIGVILYVYDRQHDKPNILTEADVHTSECADPAEILVADWGCKDWSSYIQELQIRATMETPSSEITKPQYIMTCNTNLYYGETELKRFKSTPGGFEIYLMDNSWVWLSSGNACVINDFHGTD